MKNEVKLENYYMPGDLDRAIGRFVEHYNSCRYQESLGNVTLPDMFRGWYQEILACRGQIRRKTLAASKTENLRRATWSHKNIPGCVS